MHAAKQPRCHHAALAQSGGDKQKAERLSSGDASPTSAWQPAIDQKGRGISPEHLLPVPRRLLLSFFTKKQP